MPQFALPEWTSARLVSVTPRQEHHGEELVVALTMRFRLSGPNELLDLASPTLRKGLFSAKEGQEPLPGIEAPTPTLRAKEFEGQRFTIAAKTEGATVLVDYGVEGDVKPITMGDAKVDKVSGAGYDGGSADLEFNVSTSDVDSEELGIICGNLGSEFPIKVLAPKEQPKRETDAESDPRQPTLDGTTGEAVGEPSDARKAADAAFQPGSEGMAPNGPRDATDAVLDDVQKNGPAASAKTPGQIRGAKAAATRKANAAAVG